MSLKPGHGALVPEHMASFHVIGLAGSLLSTEGGPCFKVTVWSEGLGVRHGSRGADDSERGRRAMDIAYRCRKTNFELHIPYLLFL